MTALTSPSALPHPSHALDNGRLAAARHAFSAPDRVALTAAEQAALTPAAAPPLRHEGLKLARWRWGQGPRVVLVHGWNSRGAHLLGWVPPLLAAGLSVTLFDLPGHGESGGHTASVVHAGRALQAVLKAEGPVHAVVGHSMGSAAALLALAQLPALRLACSVHLAGPSSLTPVVQGLARAHGLGPAEQAAWLAWVEGFIGGPLAQADLPALQPGLRHAALIVHDREDRTVPFSASQALHETWPGSVLEAVSGLGHRRLLQDANVIARAVEFITRHRPVSVVSPPARDRHPALPQGAD
ncbi:alpha/beta fold hydrolase [Roseateles sp. BYS87W]|uniref:Alpha/beta fold hydrolase n=1 Tax=Pelomonas baiyunensis TaxID=3299026 RepID=A0ABW7GTD8_9BURK